MEVFRKTKVDHAVVIPHDVTARIQEAHIFILHYWADMMNGVSDAFL